MPVNVATQASAGHGRPRPIARGWEPYGIEATHEASSGRLGRNRSARTPPTIAPPPKQLTSTDQTHGPPRSRLATIGPSTKSDAPAKLPMPKKTIVVQIQ